MHEKNGEVRWVYALRSELRNHHLVYVGVKPVNIDNPQRRAKRRGSPRLVVARPRPLAAGKSITTGARVLYRTQEDVISVVLIHGPKVGPLKCIDYCVVPTFVPPKWKVADCRIGDC